MNKESLKRELEEASESIELKEEIKSDFKEQEKKTISAFFDDIKDYVKHPKYDILLKYLDLVLESNKINGFILDGSFGIGKSTVIKSYLKAIHKEFFYINSYATPLAFYIEAFNHKNEVILIDDLSGLWKDEKGISILRALLNNDRKRYVHYESTSDKLKVPSSFIFEGKIIILCNNISKHLDKSVISRVVYRQLNFNYMEKIEFIEKIIKFEYQLKDTQIKEISDFIKSKIDETIIDFNFRNILKITELFLKYPSEWKELSENELQKDENMSLIKKLIEKYKSVKEQINEFTERTGLSRRTFFLRKKQYESAKVQLV